jgi:hypothetical protein
MSDSADDFELALAEGGLLLDTTCLEVSTPKGKPITLTLDAFAVKIEKRRTLRKKLRVEKVCCGTRSALPHCMLVVVVGCSWLN